MKVIDLGSSCFVSDHLSSYVQSRSYRAPEVILGLPYHQQVDVWSLGCILAELLSGYVLFQVCCIPLLEGSKLTVVRLLQHTVATIGKMSHSSLLGSMLVACFWIHVQIWSRIHPTTEHLCQ